jgi:antitoxin (DNA-binding transcriptional repressor) of toxin-antitoxin stability system
MHKSVSVTQFARNVSGYIDRVRYAGDFFSITKGTKVVAEIIPAKPTGLPVCELARVLAEAPRLGNDSTRMKKDLQKLRATSRKPLGNPWA